MSLLDTRPPPHPPQCKPNALVSQPATLLQAAYTHTHIHTGRGEMLQDQLAISERNSDTVQLWPTNHETCIRNQNNPLYCMQLEWMQLIKCWRCCLWKVIYPVSSEQQVIQTITAVDKDDFANGQRFFFALPSQLPVNPNFTLKDNEGN